MTRKAAHNSTYPKGGVSFSKDNFVVNRTLVFQIKFCGKSPALRVAAKPLPPMLKRQTTQQGNDCKANTRKIVFNPDSSGPNPSNLK